jgi:hypothetical protein
MRKKIAQIYIKSSLQFHHKQICKYYKDTPTIKDVETKYLVMCSWWSSSSIATKEVYMVLLEWLAFLLHAVRWSHASSTYIMLSHILVASFPNSPVVILLKCADMVYGGDGLLIMLQ